ncbi:hypothetical protein CDIK_1318 [Cucumispora dikerogammari]|nr:hypothetical protein CDIK_1318 [Cucumispora dikerogammari]
MSIIKLFSKTTIFSFQHVSVSLQNSPEFNFRWDIPEGSLITSSKVEDIMYDENSPVLKLEHFKLKNKKYVNSIIVPLFELRDGNGNEIETRFNEHENFNKPFACQTGNIFMSSQTFCLYFVYFIKGSTEEKMSSRNRLFFLENPSTQRMNVYIFVEYDEEDIFSLRDNILYARKLEVDRLTFFMLSPDEKTIEKNKYMVKEDGKEVWYSIFFEKAIPDITFKFDVRDGKHLSLLRNNSKDYGYMITKQVGNNIKETPECDLQEKKQNNKAEGTLKKHIKTEYERQLGPNSKNRKLRGTTLPKEPTEETVETYAGWKRDLI